MERLYRPHTIRSKLLQQNPAIENPIELDNKAFDIKDGAKKSLSYLDYQGTLAKGTLAAEGIIKLCPSCKGKFIDHYGASAPPISKKVQECETIDDNDEEEQVENEWDNIFLNRENNYEIT